LLVVSTELYIWYSMDAKLDPSWEKCIFILTVFGHTVLTMKEVTLRNGEVRNLHFSENNYGLEAKRNETRRVARSGR